jgi:transcriptional regulator with XRE-family HTH domain
MNSRSNVKAFGERVAQLRLAKGLTQKEVLARIPGTYADEKGYGRIEHGDRKPSRDIAVAILARGLDLGDAEEVNAALAILGYEGLSIPELQSYGLEGQKQAGPEKGSRRPTMNARAACLVLFLAFALAFWIVIHFDRDQTEFTITTCVLYAGLYVISLFLETVYEGRIYQSLSRGAMLFSFILITSVVALASDVALVQTAHPEGLWVSLVIFFAAGLLQWSFVRRSLPDRSVVHTTFEALTSQSAHLKNTAYFLLIVILFWIPPMHCRLVLNQQARAGHPEAVRHSLASHSVLTPEGMICPPVEWLWVLFIVMVIVSIPMGARLIENLPSHPQRNIFLNLFYLRVIVYFSLVLICLGWHSYSVGLLVR